MRYSASEKFEIIELVEQSSLSIRRTLASIGIPARSPGPRSDAHRKWAGTRRSKDDTVRIRRVTVLGDAC